MIDPHNGKVEHAQAFDTYKSSAELDDFIKCQYIHDGHVIAAACKDDCASSLSDFAKSWFEGMGSEEIRELKYR